MLNRFILSFALFFAFDAFAFGAEKATFPLAENGVALVKIAIPDAATAPEKNAAQELADGLAQITGATFEIVAQSAVASDERVVSVGRTARAESIVDFAALRPDEIRVETLGDGSLVLTGEGSRGTIYAVETFLQDVCGVRHWTKDASYYPQNKDLTLDGALKIAYAPKLIYREIYHRDARNAPKFAVRSRLNGDQTSIPQDWGGNVSILSWCHSFERYLSSHKYFKDRPDWFSEIDGKRFFDENAPDGRTQICATNEEATAVLIENVLQTLRDNPGTKIVDVSQNDNMEYCRCAKCRAIDDAEGSHAGAHLALINKVADAVAQEFPGVFVETLAYQYTRQAPKTIRPRDNVLIRLCTIECSWLRPLTDKQNEAFAKDFDDWKDVSKQLFIWDYLTNYNDYVGPFPNRRTLGPNLKFFVDGGAIGLFEEAEGDDFVEMRNWVVARLAWNPELDPEALFKEFCNGYYGPEIAPFIEKYWNVLIERAEKADLYAGCFGCDVAQWLDLETMNAATSLLDEALATARRVYGDDSAEAARLEKSKMAIDLTWLRLYWPLKGEAFAKNLAFRGPSDPSAASFALGEKCRRFETYAMTISQNGPEDLDEYFRSMKANFDLYANPPAICADYRPGEYMIFDALTFSNVSNVAEFVDDPAGWRGRSVKMGTEVDWNVQFTPPIVGKRRVFLSLRVEGTQPDGVLGRFGVYKAPSGVANFALTPEMFRDATGKFDAKFRWIDAGTVDFPGGAYCWFAHAHSPELTAIYVDRVVLLPVSEK